MPRGRPKLPDVAPTIEPSSTDLQRAAFLFESRGTRMGSYAEPVLAFSTVTSGDDFLWFQHRFGGRIAPHGGYLRLMLRGRQLMDFLSAIRPFIALPSALAKADKFLTDTATYTVAKKVEDIRNVLTSLPNGIEVLTAPEPFDEDIVSVVIPVFLEDRENIAYRARTIELALQYLTAARASGLHVKQDGLLLIFERSSQTSRQDAASSANEAPRSLDDRNRR